MYRGTGAGQYASHSVNTLLWDDLEMPRGECSAGSTAQEAGIQRDSMPHQRHTSWSKKCYQNPRLFLCTASLCFSAWGH